MCDCELRGWHIQAKELVSECQYTNIYHRLACHKAFTRAKNHKHIYTLINIIKIWCSDECSFPPETCVPNTLIQLTQFMVWRAPLLNLNPQTFFSWLKGLGNNIFCSAYNEMPCAATVNVLLKTLTLTLHTACCVHHQVLKQQTKIRFYYKQNKIWGKGYQSFCCICASWQVINKEKCIVA